MPARMALIFRVQHTLRLSVIWCLSAMAIGTVHGAAIAGPRVAGFTAGGPEESDHAGCVSPADYARVARAIERFEAGHPWLTAAAGQGFNQLEFPFYPQAGNLYGDLYTNNFVDLDSGPGILDWDCTDHTYDGHRGHDTNLRSFGEQAIGVPVFAALDGIVVDARDGFFDMSTDFSNPQPANFVVLNHGGGDYTLYWHLRNGSVAVQVGDTVAAGEQLGLTASSGYSTGPHLHFEVQEGFEPVEPSAGPCASGPSRWVDQAPVRRDLYIRDFGFVQGDLGAMYQGRPHALPRSNHLYDTVTFPDYYQASYWVLGHNMPAGGTWRVRFRSPSGIIEFDSGTNAFAWATQDFRGWWAWWRYNIDAMRFEQGEWTFELRINNEIVVEAPVLVFENAQPGLNRPPEPITVAFDPPQLVQGEAVFCRIATDLVHDDPDFDLLSYRYRWAVDGQPVRDVVTAAHSDALSSDLVAGDAQISCAVTPTDGRANAPTANTSAWVPGIACNEADISTPYGTLDLADVSGFVSGFTGGLLFADLDQNGLFDLGDITAFVTAFTGGCP